MSEQRRSLGLVGHLDVATGGANSNAAVAPPHVADQIAERLGYLSGGVLFQPKLNVCFRPPQVESAPQRIGAEPIDPATAPGLLISKHPQDRKSTRLNSSH